MKSYTAFLKHDNGRATLRVWADSLTDARRQVLDVEKCPERSIEFLGRTPTKKEVRQAKNWGY